MEKENYGLISKNIPILIKNEYIVKLFGKMEILIRTIRWKVYWYNLEKRSPKNETYGLRSLNNPLPQPELRQFEDQIEKLARFKSLRNFQKSAEDFKKSWQRSPKNEKRA